MKHSSNRPVLLRITTVPMSLKYLIGGQMLYMREHGFEVHMASAGGPERKEIIQNEGCPHHILPFTRRLTPLRDLMALGKAVHVMRSIRPDIVHTHTPKAGLIGLWAARLTGVPVRIHTLAGLPMQTAGGVRRHLFYRVERLTNQAATEVWPNNNSLRDYIIDRGMIEPSKCRVIASGSSNGIDLEYWSENAVNEEILRELKGRIDYSSDAKYFLFVGRMVQDKGIPELIRAFEALHSDGASIHLILAGSMESRRNSESLSSELMRVIENREYIHTSGWSDHIREWMALSDALVFPSHREGFPNVLLQAGAMKLPVICSDIEEHKQLISNNKTGLLFPCADSNALIHTIRHFLRSSEKMREAAERLHATIERDFQREHIHRAILDHYKRLLKRDGKNIIK